VSPAHSNSLTESSQEQNAVITKYRHSLCCQGTKKQRSDTTRMLESHTGASNRKVTVKKKICLIPAWLQKKKNRCTFHDSTVD
jgi:hypothetical protein